MSIKACLSCYRVMKEYHILSLWHFNVQLVWCYRGLGTEFSPMKSQCFHLKKIRTPFPLSCAPLTPPRPPRWRVLLPAAFLIVKARSSSPPSPRHCVDTNMSWGFDCQHWNPWFIKMQMRNICKMVPLDMYFSERTALCQVLCARERVVGRRETASSGIPNLCAFFKSGCCVNWAKCVGERWKGRFEKLAHLCSR